MALITNQTKIYNLLPWKGFITLTHPYSNDANQNPKSGKSLYHSSRFAFAKEITQEMVLFTHNFAFSTEINREKVLSTLKFPFDDELMKNQIKNLWGIYVFLLFSLGQY